MKLQPIVEFRKLFRILLSVFVFFFLAGNAHAAECKRVVNNVRIGETANGLNVLITFSDDQTFSIYHSEQTASIPAIQAFYSAALTALTSGRKVRIVFSGLCSATGMRTDWDSLWVLDEPA